MPISDQQRVTDNVRTRYQNDPEFRERRRAAVRKSQRKAKYGLSDEQYQQLRDDSKGVCKICKKPPHSDGRSLHIDHDHKTGKVRGLLCTSCNLFLGKIHESVEILQIMITYIETGGNQTC